MAWVGTPTRYVVPVSTSRSTRLSPRATSWTTYSAPPTIAVSSEPIPKLWLNGLREHTTESAPMRQSVEIARAVTSNVLSLCMTPLGAPVEPEVKAM